MATRTVAEIQADLDSTRAKIEEFKAQKIAASTVNSRQIARPGDGGLSLWMQREEKLCGELNEAKIEEGGFPGGIPVKYGVPAR